MSGILLPLLCAVVAYLLGSISTGVLYSRYLGSDVRTHGSKNSGATNMTRTYGSRPGLITFIGDCGKAILAVGFGYLVLGHTGAMITGFFVIIGHNWPVFFGFKGGKGVSCSTAVFALTFPLYGWIAIFSQIAVMLISRYVSLGSIVLFVVFAVLMLIFEDFWPNGLWAVILCLIGLWRHRANIQRLLKGSENKMGSKQKNA